MRRAYTEGRLRFTGKLAALSNETDFAAFVRARYQQEWVVYAKKPFGSPEVVLKYLARYTHRVAIANQRLVSFDRGEVTFRYKDYARNGKRRCMTLKAEEFLRRFALHTLPKGFQRIRQYGLLANRCRKKTLVHCRKLLAQKVIASQATLPSSSAPTTTETDTSPTVPIERCCPVCGCLRWVRREFDRQPGWTYAEANTKLQDTS